MFMGADNLPSRIELADVTFYDESRPPTQAWRMKKSNVYSLLDFEAYLAIGKRFGRMKTKLGFGPNYVFHSLRRTFSTQLENAGQSRSAVAQLMGHKKKRSNLRRLLRRVGF